MKNSVNVFLLVALLDFVFLVNVPLEFVFHANALLDFVFLVNVSPDFAFHASVFLDFVFLDSVFLDSSASYLFGFPSLSEKETSTSCAGLFFCNQEL